MGPGGNDMQINRLFEIVYILLEKKSTTANELATHFEVSKRTILRDIETLTIAGIPIYTTKGKGGGISILDHFILNKTTLTEEEQHQILFALQSLNAAKQVETREILAKLSALFQKSAVDWIEIDFSRWGQGASDNTKFHLLKHAILYQNAIEFEYFSSHKENSHRKVFPLKLVFKSKSWYLQSFCIDKQDYRTFKLNRMLRVSKTTESFDRSQYSPPPMEAANAPDSSLISLELVFASHAAYRVYDEFDEGAIDTADDGSLHVFTRLPEDNWLYSFLMSFGNDVAVLQPQHVKEKLVTLKIEKLHLT